jgi:hypothetical protein
MASGALPPWFPAVEIDGEYYWDGGVVSNTPLEWLARHRLPDTLAFQVDLWAAPGELPKNVPEVMTRMKENLNSSHTRKPSWPGRCVPPGAHFRAVRTALSQAANSSSSACSVREHLTEPRWRSCSPGSTATGTVIGSGTVPRRQLTDDSAILDFLLANVGWFDMYVEDDYAAYVRYCFEDPRDAEIFRTRFEPKCERFKLAG